MKLTLTFPNVCATCKREFADGEVRVGIVRAGSAWKAENVRPDGSQFVELTDGAELYTTSAYHEACAPPKEEAA